jgi:hypothetical protein
MSHNPKERGRKEPHISFKWTKNELDHLKKIFDHSIKNMESQGSYEKGNLSFISEEKAQKISLGSQKICKIDEKEAKECWHKISEEFKNCKKLKPSNTCMDREIEDVIGSEKLTLASFLDFLRVKEERKKANSACLMKIKYFIDLLENLNVEGSIRKFSEKQLRSTLQIIYSLFLAQKIVDTQVFDSFKRIYKLTSLSFVSCVVRSWVSLSAGILEQDVEELYQWVMKRLSK